MNAYRSPAPGASLFNMPKQNAVVNAANSIIQAANTALNGNAQSARKGISPMVWLLVGLVVVIAIFAGVGHRRIGDGFSVVYEKIRQAFGASPNPPPMEPPPTPVLEKPEAPQNDRIQEQKLVEKILPGRKEVFNISKNSYTYYDAEPLCKALGAELATYEQVKEAYGGGADWCNYGWTKGQMAVYPTQTSTWEQLQQGPESERNQCGQPGVNGGFFDNPELRFGVNCYGLKPDQKQHDATAIASGEGAPLSVGGLEFEKKVAKFRGEADHIPVLPFNKQTWSN
jgi:hypothetical protein